LAEALGNVPDETRFIETSLESNPVDFWADCCVEEAHMDGYDDHDAAKAHS